MTGVGGPWDGGARGPQATGFSGRETRNHVVGFVFLFFFFLNFCRQPENPVMYTINMRSHIVILLIYYSLHLWSVLCTLGSESHPLPAV